jgi:hypothetical protein
MASSDLELIKNTESPGTAFLGIQSLRLENLIYVSLTSPQSDNMK